MVTHQDQSFSHTVGLEVHMIPASAQACPLVGV